MNIQADNLGFRNFRSFHKLYNGSTLEWTKGLDQIVGNTVKTNYDVVSSINDYTGSKDMVYDTTSRKWFFRSLSLPVKYVHGTSSSSGYWKTDYIPKENTKVIIDFEKDTAVAGWTPLFGCRTGIKTAGSFEMFIRNTGANICYMFNTSYDVVNEIPYTNGTRYTASLGPNGIATVNGTSYSTAVSYTTGSLCLWIGALNENNTLCDNALNGKIYSVLIYEGDTLVRNYEPAVGGKLYDTINDSYIEPTGDATYTEINNTIYEEYGIIEQRSDLNGYRYLGKLVHNTTNNHEYEWNGVEWVDLGEVQGLRTPVGFYGAINFKIPYNGSYYILDAKNDVEMKIKTGDSIITSYTAYVSSISQNDRYEYQVFMDSGTLYYDLGYSYGRRLYCTPSFSTNTEYVLKFSNGKYLYSTRQIVINGLGKTASSQLSTYNNTDRNIALGYNYTTNYLKIYESSGLKFNFITKVENDQFKFFDTVNNIYAETSSTPTIVYEEGQLIYPKTYYTLFTPTATITQPSISDMYGYELPYTGQRCVIGLNNYFLNNNNIWTKILDYSVQPLGIHAFDGDITMKLAVRTYTSGGAYSAPTLYYSYDMSTWTQWSNVYSDLTILDGQTLYLYGPANNKFMNCADMGTYGQYKNRFSFSGTGKVRLTGQLLSLFNPDYATQPKAWVTGTNGWLHLFLGNSGSYIYDIKDMHVNFSSISAGTYNQVLQEFLEYNSHITKSCVFDRTFTSTGSHTAFLMFLNCSGMTEAEIPPLASGSSTSNTFLRLFDGCSSLTKVTYNGLIAFDGGSSVGKLQTTTPGTFYNLGGATLSNIPSNWTVKTSLD